VAKKPPTVRDLYEAYLRCIAETEQLRLEVAMLKARWTVRPPPKR
jgi:hypothetical protein